MIASRLRAPRRVRPSTGACSTSATRRFNTSCSHSATTFSDRGVARPTVTDVTDTSGYARPTVDAVTTTETSGGNYLPVMLNPFEPGYFDDPYAQYRLVREQDPVHMSPI